ncbi:hypothetical protein [Nocardia bhagyanarayanae]|uniref:hypothetical protein n=1 Tax=Nocardia bhagyanarayanae TaxID=1215925 RepID=UPI00163A8E3C|nr:hypothetical protein [Nocardia bhagyanarayanae]
MFIHRLPSTASSPGDHPSAAELAALELPTRAPLTSTVDRLAMTFHDAASV